MIAFALDDDRAARCDDVLPVRPEKDLAALTVAGTFETAFAVSPRVGVGTLDAYIAWAREGDIERRRFRVTATDGGATSLLEHHHGGRPRMLAVSGDKRLAAALAQYGLQVEGSTPQEAIDRVHAHLVNWRARMTAFKLNPLD